MQKAKILFIGHDLKFLKHIVDYFSGRKEYITDMFTYSGHVIGNHINLVQRLADADIIFCEWGLGNLSWLSKNKFPDQKIIVRIHSQEFYTDYLNLTKWQEVDKIVLVSPHMYRQFSKLYKEQKHKTTLIHNVVDCQAYNLQKSETSVFNIGLIGVLPKLKAPHLGLELLYELKKSDQQFRLFIKSKKPGELDWLLKKNEEVEYYDHFQSEIKRMNLKDSVVWEDHGNNVQEWFAKIGFILSSSDREAFHMSVAEGMASGAIPIIRNWEGADQLYPKKYIFRDIKEAAQIIIKHSEEKIRQRETKYLKKYAEKHFGLNVILNQYEQLFDEVVASINSNQQKITLRSIYSNISTEQNKNTEECNKKIQESDDKISALNNELSEKNRTIKDVCKDSQEKESIIDKLQKEVASKIQKIDSIISVADEMKEQLSSGREREKQQMKELTELKILQEKATQKAAHVTKQLNDTKTQLSFTQEQLIASKERETEKEQIIMQLRTDKEHYMNMINEIKEQLQNIQQQLNASKVREQEKDNHIAKLKQETDKHLQQIEAVNNQFADIRQQFFAASEREKEKDKYITKLKEEIDKHLHQIEAVNIQFADISQQFFAASEREKEKDKYLLEIKEERRQYIQKNETINAQLTKIQQQHTETMVRENNKDQIIEHLNKSVEAQAKETGMLKKQLAEKDLLIQEKHQELTDRENKLRNMAEFNANLESSITELNGKLSIMVQSIKGKQIQIVEQKQYIKYLEKRFFNKMIGFVRKKIRKDSDS